MNKLIKQISDNWKKKSLATFIPIWVGNNKLINS